MTKEKKTQRKKEERRNVSVQARLREENKRERVKVSERKAEQPHLFERLSFLRERDENNKVSSIFAFGGREQKKNVCHSFVEGERNRASTMKGFTLRVRERKRERERRVSGFTLRERNACQ